MAACHNQCAHERGISRAVIEHISAQKNEPIWMRDFRMNAYEDFCASAVPSFGPDLSSVAIEDLCLYCKPFDHAVRSWDEVPQAIKDTFDKLGIVKDEQYALAGLGAQFESEMIYKNLQENWAARGVIFCSMDEAVVTYPELVQRYMGTLVSCHDNRFAALNSAVWSGGSFIYVPPGVTVGLPIQAYFRMQQERMGQFERTLLIADQHSNVDYIEGCSAPLYTKQSLHSAVVEIFVSCHARVRYTTMQNWSTNVYNLVTKRATVAEHGVIEWIDGNFGSAVTMKYPAMILAGSHARGFMMSLAIAGAGQHHHTGGKIIHKAPYTAGTILAQSLAHNGGITTYCGTVVVDELAHHAQSSVNCDSLLMDDRSTASAQPSIAVAVPDATVCHEASVSSFDQLQETYMASRGIDGTVARVLLVNGFVEPFVQELPPEYGIELARLMMLSIDHTVG